MINFLDMFAGIGGFRLGMEAAGHHCLGFCETDRFARASYQAIHETKGELEWHDIRQITNEEWRELRGSVDVLCGGFPCQAFSLAGKRLGFEDTRGTLFLNLLDVPRKSNHIFYSLKTSEAYSVTTKDKHLQQS